jgi:hypothetical protein
VGIPALNLSFGRLSILFGGVNRIGQARLVPASQDEGPNDVEGSASLDNPVGVHASSNMAHWPSLREGCSLLKMCNLRSSEKVIYGAKKGVTRIPGTDPDSVLPDSGFSLLEPRVTGGGDLPHDTNITMGIR